MKFIRKTNYFFVLTLYLLSMSLASGLEIDKSNYENKTFVLRKILNHSMIFYPDPPFDSSLVFAQFEDSRIFLYRKDRLVSLEKLKIKDDGAKIELEYYCDISDKQTIKFFSPQKSPITKEIFENLFYRMFSKDTLGEEYQYYSIDTLKQRIHIRGCNHIPDNSYLADGKDISAYKDYSFCTSCFKPVKRIPNIDSEIALAQASAAEYRKYNMVIVNDSLQNYITKIGQKVLKGWPLELRGYEYKFIAVENSYPSALALPAGTIFIHSGVFDLCDDEKELEAIIAHEIAHVELRHGYRTLLKSERNKVWGAIATLATGVIIGLATDDMDAAQISLGIAKSITEVSSSLALAGYSREFESEADEFATLYMYNNYNDQNNIYLKSILDKMKYAFNETEYDLNSSSLDSHPPVIGRIITLRDMKFEYFDNPISFFGVDSLNREVAIVSFKYATTSTYEKFKSSLNDITIGYRTKLYASIESTELLYLIEKAKNFSIWYEGKRYNFDNKEDTQIMPLSEISCVFVNESDSPFPLNELHEFKAFHLPLGTVRLWGVKNLP